MALQCNVVARSAIVSLAQNATQIQANLCPRQRSNHLFLEIGASTIVTKKSHGDDELLIGAFQFWPSAAFLRENKEGKWDVVKYKPVPCESAQFIGPQFCVFLGCHFAND